MKWNYRQYSVDESSICPSGIVYRPVAKLRVAGPSGETYVRLLIDTGADHTLLPMSVADRVGAHLFHDDYNSAKGVSGHEISIIPGRVQLELISDNGCYQWSAVIGFAEFASPEEECSLLGHAGCLEFFTATFDGVARVFELLPRFGSADTSLPSRNS
jgi:hypothetical protein